MAGRLRFAVVVVGEGVKPEDAARVAKRLLDEGYTVLVLVPGGEPFYEMVLPEHPRLFVAPHTYLAPPVVAYIVTAGVLSGLLGVGQNRYGELEAIVEPVGDVHDALLAMPYAAILDVAKARGVKLHVKLLGARHEPLYYDVLARELLYPLRRKYVENFERIQPGLMSIILENLLTPFNIASAVKNVYVPGKGMVTQVTNPDAFELRVRRDWEKATGKLLSPIAEEMLHYFVKHLREMGALTQVYYARGRHRYYMLRTKPHGRVLKSWRKIVEHAERDAEKYIERLREAKTRSLTTGR